MCKSTNELNESKSNMLTTAMPGMIFWLENPSFFNKPGRHLFLIISEENIAGEYTCMQINTAKKDYSLPVCLKRGEITYISCNKLYTFKNRDIGNGKYYGMIRNNDFLPREEILELCMETYLFYNGIRVSNTHFGEDAVNFYVESFNSTYKGTATKEEREKVEPRREYEDPSKPLTSKIPGLDKIRESLPEDKPENPVDLNIRSSKPSSTLVDEKKFPDWKRMRQLMDVAWRDLGSEEQEELTRYFRAFQNRILAINTGMPTQKFANKRYTIKKAGVDVECVNCVH